MAACEWFKKSFTFIGLDFPEVRYGLIIWSIALVPVVSFVLGAELLVDVDGLISLATKAVPAETTGSVINYMTFGITHTVLCGYFILKFFTVDFEHVTPLKQNKIKWMSLILFLLVSAGFILTLIFLNTATEHLSHQLIYPHLKKIPALGKWFDCPAWLNWCPIAYPFSFFAIGLILLGELSGVCITFQISQILVRMESIHNLHDWEANINYLFKQFQACVLKLVVVLVTSSTTTSLYFFMPRALDGASSPAYNSYARALSVYWGTMFTLMAISILVWPYLCYRRRLTIFFQISRAEDPSSTRQLTFANEGLQLIQDNILFIASLVLPLIAAIVSPLL